MADHDMSPLHGKKPCRACTSFKSWMKQENRRKSTAVSFYLTMKVKELEHTLTFFYQNKPYASNFEIDTMYYIISYFLVNFTEI